MPNKSPAPFKPIHDNLLIRRDPPEKKFMNLHIVSEKVLPCFFGTVLAAGPGAKAKDGRILSMSVKVGDRVCFGSYGPTRVDLGDGPHEHCVISAENLLAVFE